MSRRASHILLLLAAALVALAPACRRAPTDTAPTANGGAPGGSPASAPADATRDHIGDDGVPAERLQPANFTYEGAFRLPPDFNWGARGLSCYPAGGDGAGSLLVTGFELLSDPAHPGESCWDATWNCGAYYGEVSIPAPARATDWHDLPEATLRRPLTGFDGGLAAAVHREYVYVEDLEFVPRRGSQRHDKLYGSLIVWYAEGAYGEETFPTVWMANLDGTAARGMFHVGPRTAPFHGRKMGAYLFTAPTWYADEYLGGRTLLTGRSRGTPADSAEPVTVRGGSQGPTLFAFTPWDTDDPAGPLDALPLLYYRVAFPGCAGPTVGDKANCDYPGYTMCDEWTGGAFVDDGARRAILLLGHKGLGDNCYDEPPVDCDDPCSDAHGYHCQPYERQIIFYDVRALGQIARGQRDPWTVVPYVIWRPAEFYLGTTTCANTGGMAFDAHRRRLYVAERGLDGDANAVVIHVWSLAAGRPDRPGD